MTKHVALYARLSPRPDGSYEGVPAQEKWGRAYSAAKWPGMPVKVFADAGISAANGDHRPGYEDLRAAVIRGEVAHLWAVEQSRLERREVEWFALAAELDAAGVDELHTDRDGVVRVRDEVAGIKAVLAAGEVRKLRKRVNDKLAENAANGRPPGSRPFGYVHGKTDAGEKTYIVVPEEADAIRWAAEKVMDGWSLTNIAKELRDRGLHGPHRVKVRDESGEVVTDAAGNPVTRPSALTAGSVKNWVTKPTAYGLRVHQGRVKGRGNWAPILDETIRPLIVAKLSAPRTVATSDGRSYPVSSARIGTPTGRKYTLTGGLAVCGVCQAPMVGSVKQLRNAKGVRSVPYLLCHPVKGGRACVGIMLEPTEENVADRLFAELDKPAFLAALTADDHVQRRDEIAAELTGLDEGDRAELAAEWGRGELTAAEWRAARRGLDEREQRLRQELAELPPPVMHLDIAGARQAWPDMTLDEKRELLRMFIDRVTIIRATPGTRGFDENRVKIKWREL